MAITRPSFGSLPSFFSVRSWSTTAAMNTACTASGSTAASRTLNHSSLGVLEMPPTAARAATRLVAHPPIEALRYAARITMSAKSPMPYMELYLSDTPINCAMAFTMPDVTAARMPELFLISRSMVRTPPLKTYGLPPADRPAKLRLCPYIVSLRVHASVQVPSLYISRGLAPSPYFTRVVNRDRPFGETFLIWA